MRKVILLVIASLFGVVATVPPASAQDAYEPTVTVCFDVEVATIDAEGRVTLIGPPRCAPPGVVIIVLIGGTTIGQTTSLEDGSFSTTLALPSEVGPGTHQLTVRIGEEEFVVPIEVAPAAARSAPADNSPFGLWTLVLLAAVAAAAVFGWKRVGGPRARRRSQTATSPSPQRIDTTQFVPSRAAVGESPSDPRE